MTTLHDRLHTLYVDRKVGSIMKIGFTGTQHGMSRTQKLRLRRVLLEQRATELHHGDCVGADAEAHKIARTLMLRIVVHPPLDSTKRAFCEADEVRPAAPYLERNRHIVDETKMLIAAPQEDQEIRRSGTWATIRYARKIDKFIWRLSRLSA